MLIDVVYIITRFHMFIVQCTKYIWISFMIIAYSLVISDIRSNIEGSILQPVKWSKIHEVRNWFQLVWLIVLWCDDFRRSSWYLWFIAGSSHMLHDMFIIENMLRVTYWNESWMWCRSRGVTRHSRLRRKTLSAPYGRTYTRRKKLRVSRLRTRKWQSTKCTYNEVN